MSTGELKMHLPAQTAFMTKERQPVLSEIIVKGTRSGEE